MQCVNIFLNCPAELHDDALEISDFINTLNDLFVERDLYLNLSVCDDGNTSTEEMEKQKQEIQDSQLFVILFYKKAGQHALENFDEAYAQFKESGAPAILAFFRTDGTDPTAEVKAFMDRLDQELGHYFKTYSDIDALKLYLLMQIKNMGFDIDTVFENGQAYVGNEPLLAIEYLPELIKNMDWKKLKDDQEKIEEEYIVAQAEYVSDMNNETAYKQFIEIASKRNNLKDQIEQLEKNIIRLTGQSVDRSAKGNLTPRQREAYRLLEQGKYREADSILEEGETLADIDQGLNPKQLKQQAIEQMKFQLESSVDEILDKIDIKMTLVENPDRFREIEEMYENVVKLEEEEDLNRNATRKYIQYLEDQREYSRGIQLARRYSEYQRQSEEKLDVRDGEECLASLLSHQTDDVNNLKEAETLYREVIDIDRELIAGGMIEESEDLAVNCVGLANLLSACSNAESQIEAEALYREAIELERRLALETPGESEHYLSVFLDHLASLLAHRGDTQSQNEPEMLYRESLEISRRLAAESPELYEADLASSCNNLAGFLADRTDDKSLAEAEDLYGEAIEIWSRLAVENPGRYEEDLNASREALEALQSRRSQEES